MRIIQFTIAGIITLFMGVSSAFLSICVMLSTLTITYSYLTQDYRPLSYGIFGIVLGAFVVAVIKVFNDKVFYEYISVIFDEDKIDNSIYQKYKKTFTDYSYERIEQNTFANTTDEEYIKHLKRLGITDDIKLSEKTVKAAFKEQAKKLHPDLNKDKDTTKDMQEINESLTYVINNIEYIKKKRGK